MVQIEVIIAMANVVISMAVLMLVYALRYKKVPPNKAMVVYGRKTHPGMRIGYQTINGGGKFLLPIIESCEYLDLEPIGLDLVLDDIHTTYQGTPANARCRATAVVKIPTEKNALYVATEHLMGKSRGEIAEIARLVIEGAIHERYHDEPFETLDKDFDSWLTYVQRNVAMDLLNVGIEIRFFNMHDTSLKGEA